GTRDVPDVVLHTPHTPPRTVGLSGWGVVVDPAEHSKPCLLDPQGHTTGSAKPIYSHGRQSAGSPPRTAALFCVTLCRQWRLFPREGPRGAQQYAFQSTRRLPETRPRRFP